MDPDTELDMAQSQCSACEAAAAKLHALIRLRKLLDITAKQMNQWADDAAAWTALAQHAQAMRTWAAKIRVELDRSV